MFAELQLAEPSKCLSAAPSFSSCALSPLQRRFLRSDGLTTGLTRRILSSHGRQTEPRHNVCTGAQLPAGRTPFQMPLQSQFVRPMHGRKMSHLAQPTGPNPVPPNNYTIFAADASPPVAGVQNLTYTSALIHRVTVTLNTAAGARIYYRLGSDTDGFSAEASFLSHPGVGADVNVTIMVLADMDVQCFGAKKCNPQSVLRALTASNSQLVSSANGGAVFCGDLSYASGNQSHWDAWQDFFDPVSSQMPILANAGNHEGDEHGECEGDSGLHIADMFATMTTRQFNSTPGFIPFKTRFGGMPFASPLSDDSGPMWYR